jgi:hypothetical protein
MADLPKPLRAPEGASKTSCSAYDYLLGPPGRPTAATSVACTKRAVRSFGGVILVSSSAARLPTPEGPGSVPKALSLPAGFTDAFTSRYIDTGEVRQHAVIGGDGPPLVRGWLEGWCAWRLLLAALARNFQVVFGRAARYRFVRQASEAGRTPLPSPATTSGW